MNDWGPIIIVLVCIIAFTAVITAKDEAKGLHGTDDKRYAPDGSDDE